MKATIVGIEHIEYTKKDGTDVDAHQFHLTRKDMNVSGTCTEQVYLSTKQLNNLGVAVREDDYIDLIERPVNVDYNSKGFVVGFELLDE